MNRTTRRRTVTKAAGLIASMALMASASSVFASEQSHVVTWQLPSGAWSGDGDFFDLPNRSYGYSGPVSQSATFPQTLVGEGQLMPACDEWAQVDFYKVDSENDQALYDSLIEGGVLGWNKGPADSAIYSGSQGYGFYFVYGGDCEQPSESPSEEPSESPSEEPSESPSEEPERRAQRRAEREPERRAERDARAKSPARARAKSPSEDAQRRAERRAQRVADRIRRRRDRHPVRDPAPDEHHRWRWPDQRRRRPADRTVRPHRPHRRDRPGHPDPRQGPPQHRPGLTPDRANGVTRPVTEPQGRERADGALSSIPGATGDGIAGQEVHDLRS